MDGTTVETLFNTILPYKSIKAAAGRLGVVKRDRYLDPMTLVLSLVLNGGTAEAGRIAAALRDVVPHGFLDKSMGVFRPQWPVVEREPGGLARA